MGMTAKNKHSLELKLGKVGLILFIIGMSFLMFGSFMFGVHVGKEMEAYPEKIAGYYPGFFKGNWNWSWPWNKKIRETELASEGESKTDGAKSSPGLTFYDTLAKKKSSDTLASHQVGSTAVKDAGTPSGRTEMQESPVTVGGPAAGPSNAPLKPENVPDNKSSIVSQATTPSQAINDSAIQAGKTGDAQGVSRNPEAKKTAVSSKAGKKYLLQVASYKEKDKSDQVSRRMQKLGYNSHVVPVNIKGKGMWYRVIIGGYESEGKAKKAVGELAGKTKGLHAIVRPES